jgi:hypothetical protein
MAIGRKICIALIWRNREKSVLILYRFFSISPDKTSRYCGMMSGQLILSGKPFNTFSDQEMDVHLFMFLSSPKQTKCTLENDVIHHCKHETIISCRTRF